MKKRTFNKAMIAVNIGLFLVMVITSLYYGDVKAIGLAFPTLAYAGFFWIIDRKDKNIDMLIDSGKKLIAISNILFAENERYETLYGKLPEEEPKQETNESERTDENKD